MYSRSPPSVSSRPKHNGCSPTDNTAATGQGELDACVTVDPVRHRTSLPQPDYILRQGRHARAQLVQA